jgi:hypothetical protein
MPIKNQEKRRLKQKLQKQKKRNEIYKTRDLLTSVSPFLKNKDGSDSPFTFTPIILTAKDKNTLNKLITGQFI